VELQAAVDAAQAAVKLSGAQLDRAIAAQKVAQADYERAKRLADAGTISSSAFDQAAATYETANAAIEEARAQLTLRRSELSSANARLIEPSPRAAGAEGDDACCLTVYAPVTGVVLKVISESEQVVAAGTPLVEIGNPHEMEVVVPLLSTDAAAIAPGTPATIDGWGGPALSAKVKSVDPAAYTKTSALGIEEQRVDVTLDLTDPYDMRERLGHGFRVRVHLATWSSDAVLRVPLAALFREGSDWAVYRVVDGRAALTKVTIDHRNTSHAEVTGGLSAGDTVVLHPSDTISDGTLIESR
jgi:HlyD family secretion protein